MLNSILAQFNIEQSSSYPPKIYEAHYNTITSYLLSKISESYPSSQSFVDIIDPFVKQELLPIKNGYVELPEDYRGLLGNPMIFSSNDNSSECSNIPISATSFNDSINKSRCKLNPLIIVPESEFAYRTRSTYDFPTIQNPIGYFSSKKKIKVCPFDLSKILLTYCRNEKRIVVFYDMQPDDTYLINSDKSEEPEWGNNAFIPIFKSFISLYSAYSRDRGLTEWTAILNQIGLV